jgi:predicted aspartyl protease
MYYFFEKIIKICNDKEIIALERICQSENESQGNSYIEKPIAGITTRFDTLPISIDDILVVLDHGWQGETIIPLKDFERKELDVIETTNKKRYYGEKYVYAVNFKLKMENKKC